MNLNHLDYKNRQILLRKLAQFPHTLIMVSHDEGLIDKCSNVICNIEDEEITVSHGNYTDYINIVKNKQEKIKAEFSKIKLLEKDAHYSLMQEQSERLRVG